MSPALSRKWALYADHIGPIDNPYMRGGYTEHVPGCRCMFPLERLFGAFRTYPCRYFGPGSVIRRKAEDLHRLELIGLDLNGPAWTFVISSNYFRRWGFQTADGWVPYEDYKGEA